MITIIYSIPMNNLDAALERAVAGDPGLATARALLLHPLRLLAALGTDADAALRDDGYAIERMRILLTQATLSVREMVTLLRSNTKRERLASANEVVAIIRDEPEQPEVELDDESDEEGGDDAESEADEDSTKPKKRRLKLCRGALIDLSALVVVGLAAARVGSRASGPNVARDFVSTVEALATAALLAESLTTALSDGLSDEQLIALLGSVRSHSSPQLAALAPLLLDNVERVRFEAIQSLFQHIRLAARGAWDSTFDRHIVGVERIDANRVKIRLDVDGDNQRTNALLVRLEGAKATAKFVFWTFAGEIVEVAATRIWKPDDFAELPLPADARPGWLGIATDEDKQAARAARRELRSQWKRLDNEPPLRPHSFPVDVIHVPNVGEALPPPRSAVACWGISLAEVELVQPGRTDLREGLDAELRVRTDRAPDSARLALEVGPVDRLTADIGEDERAGITVPGEWIRSGAELRLRLFVGSSAVPDDERTIRVVTTPTPVSRPIVVVPFEFIGLGKPVAIPAARIESLIADARRRFPTLEFVQLPWLGEDDRQVRADPSDLSSVAIEALLGKLARLAGRTEGLEQAQLIGLIPGTQRLASSCQPAEAAACIGVATEASAAELLRPLASPPEPRPRRKRLRLIGMLTSKGVQLQEPVRVMTQAAGLGAPHPSEYELVIYGADERELGRQPLSVHSASGTGDFVALVELPDQAQRVEIGPRGGLRRSPLASPVGPLISRGLNLGALASVRPADATPVVSRPWLILTQPSGTPAIELVDGSGPTLAWRYSHGHGVPGTFEVEVEHGGSWWRVARLEAVTSFVLEPAVLGLPVRVVASDGWSTVSATRSPGDV